MKKRATYLDDSLIDYRRIVLTIVLVIMCTFGVSFLKNVADDFFGIRSRMEAVDVTADLKEAKKLRIINNSRSVVTLEYSQFNDENEYRSNNDHVKVEFTKSHDGREVTMNLSGKPSYRYETYGAALLMYGPSLDEIEVSGPVNLQYSGVQSIAIVNNGANFRLRAGGRYDNVTITSDRSSTSRLDSAVIKNLKVHLDAGVVTAGQVDNLDAEFLTGCENRPVNAARNVLTVESVLHDSIIYNGAEQPAQSVTNDCGRVVIGRP